MLTMHPTVLVGPSDWDAVRLPKEEFAARIAALFAACGTADAVLVYGDPYRHAELVYLTNFLPKLDSTIALIPRGGAPQLLFGGGANMIGSARPLTWIEELAPLRGGGETAAQWLRDLATEGKRVVFVGSQDMPAALRSTLLDAAGPLDDVTPVLRALMRRKRPRELALLREACAMLAAAAAALAEAQAQGATAALLAAERAARRCGAQDVRTLFSTDGGRSMRPFEGLVERIVDPLQVYIAVRHRGYWADGFVHQASGPSAAFAQAAQALRAALAAVRAGVSARALGQAMAQALRPCAPHPAAIPFGNSIGLALEEPPLLTPASNDGLEEGGVYSLRAGAIDDGTGAIVSALICVGRSGTDILWATPS